MAGDLEAGFAKLQGEDFEYYMQTYSIVLGRNSKKSSVDVDLAGLGGGMNISRQHARIFYDFDSKRFALEVLGKNGCHVEGVLYHPGTLPVKLESQYLVQIGDKKFYFLLPIRSILRHPSVAPAPSLHAYASPMPSHSPLVMPTIAPAPIPLPLNTQVPLPIQLPPTIPGSSSRKRSSSKPPTVTPMSGLSPLMLKSEDCFQAPIAKKSRGQKKHEPIEMAASAAWLSHDSTQAFMMPSTHARQSMVFQADKSLNFPEPKVEVCRTVETPLEASPIQVEEKEVVSAVATVLSDLCAPGEWMPMPDLHSELFDHFGSIWPPQRVRKFLTAEGVDGENKARPWVGLLALLRKYSEHFVITTRTKGRITSEFVSLVSLLS